MIDCFLIGHNNLDFGNYVNIVKKMGEDSGAYRDLNLSYLRYKNRPINISQLFNHIYSHTKPHMLSETFSGTIAYLGTFLNKNNLTFDYVNSFQEEKDFLGEQLRQENILTIGITTTLYVFIFPILEIVKFIRQYNKTAKIIIGGPFISSQCRIHDDSSLQYLFQLINADFYVNSSQGEHALVSIIDALKNNKSFDSIDNIYYKSGNSYHARSKSHENNKLFENIVNWDLFSDRIGEYVSFRTSISCPFACKFCGYPEHAGKYQIVSPELIAKEMDRLNKIETIKSISIIDDTFNVPIERFKEILRMIINKRYKFRWTCNFRCQFADREMIELMKDAGCEGVFLGLESGNDQILRNMNKSSTVEKYLYGTSLLKEYEILTFGSFIIGFPGETQDTVKDTISLIKESGINFYRAQLWYCDPITPIWKERGKYNLSGSNFEWQHSTLDSKTACNLIDEIFLNIKDPIWIPQYNFYFESVLRLKDRGMTYNQVKEFVNMFNETVRERILNPSKQELSPETVQKFREIWPISNTKAVNSFIDCVSTESVCEQV